MAMADDQLTKATAWLETHFPAGLKCSACGVGSPQLSKDLFTLQKLYHADVEQSPSQMSLIVSECDGCGNVQFFNAATIGLVKKR